MHVTPDDGYSVSDDPERIDRAWVATWLAEQSYWATGRPRDVQDRAMNHSLCFAGIRRHVLVSSTAQALYSRFGYTALNETQAASWMLLEAG